MFPRIHSNFNHSTVNMKVVIITLFALVAVAQAYYQKPAENQLHSTQCFPDRCATCQNHFGSNLKSFDCEGRCGLCALFNASTLSIVPGCAYCSEGIDACVATCKKGQKICSAKSGLSYHYTYPYHGPYNYSYYKYKK